MEPKLYVGNLSFSTTADELRALFAQAGTVASADLIMDRFSGTSKGFAFVTMGSQAEAEKAISMFNGYQLGGRDLRVSIARPREESGRGGGYESRGYGGGGGGRGSDRRGGNDRRGGGGGTRRY